MNSTGIRWAALIILGVSFAGFFFGTSLPVPLMAKFFLGAFGFGTGVVLLIVSKVLRVKEHEGPEGRHYSGGHYDGGHYDGGYDDSGYDDCGSDDCGNDSGE